MNVSLSVKPMFSEKIGEESTSLTSSSGLPVVSAMSRLSLRRIEVWLPVFPSTHLE